MTADPFKRQREYHQRLLKSGSVRIPGGLLTPEAAQALEQITASGMSKSAAINAALIAYSLTNKSGTENNT